MKKLLISSSIMAVVAGIIMILGGGWAITFTYTNVSREMIITPPDASIPKARVLGPLTLRAQADIIRKHTLEMTGGKVYAEMPRQIQKLDAVGQVILGEDGNPVMVPNAARDIWITATTLITALNLGIITYALSGLILFFGFVSVWTGITFYVLSKKY